MFTKPPEVRPGTSWGSRRDLTLPGPPLPPPAVKDGRGGMGIELKAKEPQPYAGEGAQGRDTRSLGCSRPRSSCLCPTPESARRSPSSRVPVLPLPPASLTAQARHLSPLEVSPRSSDYIPSLPGQHPAGIGDRAYTPGLLQFGPLPSSGNS